MDLAAHGVGPHHEELAFNALERALLLCDGSNPQYGENRRDARIQKALTLLCLNRNGGFSLRGLALECGMSRSHFAKLFREQAGVTPLAFWEKRRMLRVQELLTHTGLGLAEIAEQTGFSSPYYLSLRFKKHFGVSPRACRGAGGIPS